MCTTYLPTMLVRDWVSKGQTVPFRDADWTDHPAELRELISQMLNIEPSSRPSAEEVLAHSYFNLDE